MRLFVLGATGKTGQEILDLAQARGHQVTALARSPQKLAGRAAVTVVQGDALRAASVAAALPGHDAVLSTLGAPPRQTLRPSTFMADTARATVEAMTISGVTRLVILSAAVLFPGKGLGFAFFRWMLQHHARDLSVMEALVRDSGLAWTIARPPRLTRAPDARFEAMRDGLPSLRPTTHRAVAAFMLDAVERQVYIRNIVGLSRG